MNQEQNKGRAIALLPIGVFLVIFLGSGIITGDFYAMPAIVAFLIALCVAFLQNKKLSFEEKIKIIAKGVGDENIITMCLIFLCAGAFSGAVTAAGGVLGKVISSIVIILITFKHKTWFDLLKSWLYFYFVSFVIGGILLGVHFMFQQSVHVDSGSFMTVTTGYGTPISWGFVIIGFPICWYFTKHIMDKQALMNFQSDQLFTCEIAI